MITEAGCDPAHGARPLRRAIQQLLENPLVLQLPGDRFAEGDVVRADAGLGEIRLAGASPLAESAVA